MTTYSEFQDYYTEKMWRTGDTAWTTNLPTLIRKAEARISRDLRVNDLYTDESGDVTVPYIDRPGDFREMVSLQYVDTTGNLRNSATALPLQQFVGYSSKFDQGDTSYAGCYYTVTADQIKLLANASVEAPVGYQMTYIRGITGYETDPAEPFYDLEPDFFEAALNIQAYDWLKDYNLVQTYNDEYTRLLNGMVTDSNYKIFPSGQLPAANIPSGVR